MPTPTGVILVDHGSRRQESNEQLDDVVRLFAACGEASPGARYGFQIVEPAHMELASPTIRQAFARCVQRGAKSVIAFPYFLAPGRHWHEDIPRLVAEAAAEYPGVPFLVTAPLGPHPAMADIINDRIAACLQRQQNPELRCDMCQDGDGCVMESR